MGEATETPGGRRERSGPRAGAAAAAPGARIGVSREPLNAEAPLGALGPGSTPTAQFYVRNHFPIPAEPAGGWQVRVEGAVAQPLTLTLDALRGLPARTVTATLECAGNDRLGFTPLPPGEPWDQGALSTATWRGVALRDVLDRAGLSDSAVEVLCEGADRGQPAGVPAPIPFARALPRAKAQDADTLLVYEMNGAPLPPAHGGPLRLLAPDWYGMASVKWLARLVALEAPFVGFYQTDRYIMQWPDGRPATPLQAMAVKSLITTPQAGARLAPGPQEFAGLAWSGASPITRVDVAVDEGPWQPAQLGSATTPHAWQPWTFAWTAPAPGRYKVRVRATDVAGQVQPAVAPWNILGYVNNAIQAITFEVATPGG